MSSAAEHLPPLVTKIKGDISDLKGAFAESIADAKAWAAEMKRTLTAEMRVIGKTTSETFRTETRKGFDGLADDAWSGSAAERFGRAGAKAAEGFGGGFSSVAASSGPYGLAAIVTLALGAAVLLSPAIGAAIGAALTVGLGAGFLGLGLFLLKDDKRIISEAAMLGKQMEKTFTDAAKPLKGPFLEAIRIFRALVKDIGPDMKGIFKSLAPTVAPLATGVSGFVSGLMGGIGEAVANSAPLLLELAKQLPGLGESLGRFFVKISENGPALTRFLQDAFTFLNFFIVALGDTIAWLTGAYLWMAKFADGTKTWLGEAGDTIKGWYDNVVSWLGGAVDWVVSLPGKIRDGLMALPGVLAAAAQTFFTDFTYAIGYGVGMIIGFFRDMPGNARTFIIELYTTVTGWVSRMITTAVGWVMSLGPKAKSGFSDFTKKAKQVLSDAPGWLVQTGKDMLAGLVRGITDSLGWAIGKVKEGMRNIAQGAKDALGISSPSKVFAQIGRYSVEGYAQGISANAGTAWAAWAGLLQPSAAGRPVPGGTAGYSREMAGADRGRGGYAAVQTGSYGVAVVMLDKKVLATAMIEPMQRANLRNNRAMVGLPS